jgi:hypothetical protein
MKPPCALVETTRMVAPVCGTMTPEAPVAAFQ